MTGLDLETFLLLLRADLGAWVVLGVAGVGLAMLVWSTWGSRRMLRRCLVLSLAAHLGLAICGSTVPAVRRVVRGGTADPSDREHIRRIRVAPLLESSAAARSTGRPGEGKASASGERLELAAAAPTLADPELRVARPPIADNTPSAPATGPLPGSAPALAAATPHPTRPSPEPMTPDPRPASDPVAAGAPPVPPTPTPPDPGELERTTVAATPSTAGSGASSPKPESSAIIERAIGAPNLALHSDGRLRPGRPVEGQQAKGDRSAGSGTSPRGGESANDTTASGRPAVAGAGGGMASASTSGPLPGGGPLAMEHVTPAPRSTTPAGTGLAPLSERPAVRTPAEVPRVYRSRVEPDRPTRARLAGASAASELAVERALDWLARHQDRDGRWNAAVARYDNGKPVPGDRDFSAHCPADEVCSGPCAYWEADTALTGLALLTYLGAGYTHQQGRYAETVDKGLNFLIEQQKADGDLRGESVVVGMYCHAMATLALCEGYALTGDVRLRGPAERAVAFLVRSRARDRQSWRYRPGERIGDTSILGWVVMSLKSAKLTGLPIAEEASVRRGVLDWLDRVSSGEAGGLACYQPAESVTPTMTAEAWVCRQFLDVGGPGPTSTEAAEFLLRKENESDRGRANFYYWYYATLALYQHGGEPWARWNAATRDRIVRLQHVSGHRAGSWDPDDSLYGPKGGRIYCTALAALTLEVYYRYLRLYDEPKLPSGADEPPGLAPPRRAASRPRRRSIPRIGESPHRSSASGR